MERLKQMWVGASFLLLLLCSLALWAQPGSDKGRIDQLEKKVQELSTQVDQLKKGVPQKIEYTPVDSGNRPVLREPNIFTCPLAEVDPARRGRYKGNQVLMGLVTDQNGKVVTGICTGLTLTSGE